MPLYVAQCKMFAPNEAHGLDLQRNVVSACAQFTRWGRPVRFVCCLLVPSEACGLYLFESSEGAHVRDVSEAAQLPFTQVVEVVHLSV